MKTFIFSYITSVMVMISASFSAMQAAPLDVIPRILFYFGLPSAVALSMVIIVLSHALGLAGRSFDPGMLHASEGMTLNPAGKAA
jgi:hypothetical protein